MILVLGSVVVQDGRIDAALEVSLDHVCRSRREPGCVSHAVYRDVENPQRLVFVEQWADQAALAEHFKVPASRQFVKSLGALAAEPPSMSLYAAEQLQS
jgi:quinol monooxygenase YgiN